MDGVVCASVPCDPVAEGVGYETTPMGTMVEPLEETCEFEHVRARFVKVRHLMVFDFDDCE